MSRWMSRNIRAAAAAYRCSALGTVINLIALVPLLWQPYGCQAADYNVGGDGVWQLVSDFYQPWADGIQFVVGDTIAFTYYNTLYDVRSVPSAAELAACYLSNSTLIDNSGYTVVALTIAKTYFLLDGTSNGLFCSSGMAFQVIVMNATGSTSPPPPSRRPPPPGRTPAFGTPPLFPYLFAPPDSVTPEAAGSKVNVVAAVGGSVGGVVGLGALVTIFYKLLPICLAHGFRRHQGELVRPGMSPTPTSWHSSGHGSSPAPTPWHPTANGQPEVQYAYELAQQVQFQFDPSAQPSPAQYGYV